MQNHRSGCDVFKAHRCDASETVTRVIGTRVENKQMRCREGVFKLPVLRLRKSVEGMALRKCAMDCPLIWRGGVRFDCMLLMPPSVP